MLSNLISGFFADCKGYSVPVATVRAIRASRIYGMGDLRQQLSANAAFSSHVSTGAKHDPIFFLSHRHFLARGLTAQQRAEIAVVHYQHEVNALNDSYFEAVYRDDGLVLWKETIEGETYDIRLMPGNDVLYEGGLSLVFHFNGIRICVVSFSTVPTKMFLPDFAPGKDEPQLQQTIFFVTRKQLTTDRSYQKAFNKAFDRSTPAHFCFGALTGLALAEGHRYFVGIEPEVHPSYTNDLREHFATAYTEFWESLSGRKVSPFGYLIDLPMKMTPLDNLEASKRKRALSRRKHIETVRNRAFQTLRPYMVAPVAAASAQAIEDQAIAAAARMAPAA